MDEVGSWVKRERTMRGWSQRDLAKRAKVTAETISTVETGQHDPRPSTLRKLADAFGVEVREFFEEPATAGKAEAPSPGPTLLERALEAARTDEEKESQARARLHASEGEPQSASAYEEDKFRAALRALGFPDEYFEDFIWPLVIESMRLREENAVLRDQLQERERAHS